MDEGACREAVAEDADHSADSDQTARAGDNGRFAALFAAWRAAAGAHGEGQQAAPSESTMRHLAAAVACLPSRSLEDLAYKLALWRWTNPALVGEEPTLSKADAIAYSAFRDLVRLVGNYNLCKDEDLATEFYSGRLDAFR